MGGLGMALGFLMGLISIIGGVIIIVAALQQRTKRLEMLHRERLAMIERGLVPPSRGSVESAAGPHAAAPRFTSFGVAIVGVGFALMFIIGLAGGAPEAGVGVGGAVAILGAAFIVNGYLQRHAYVPPPASPSMSVPSSSSRSPGEPSGPLGP